MNGAAVSRQAPHPHAALLYLDFLLTDGQALLARRDVVPASRNVDSQLARFAFKVTDPAILLDQGDKWTRLYQDVINTPAK